MSIQTAEQQTGNAKKENVKADPILRTLLSDVWQVKETKRKREAQIFQTLKLYFQLQQPARNHKEDGIFQTDNLKISNRD